MKCRNSFGIRKFFTMNYETDRMTNITSVLRNKSGNLLYII